MRTPAPEIVAQVMAELRPTRIVDEDGSVSRATRCLRKGMPERRIIAQKVINGVEYAYHATKGWRTRWVGT